MNQNAKEMLDFIHESPSCFHVVKNLSKELSSKGFEEISEKNEWNLKAGGKYFVTRNGSSIVSFVVPESGKNFDGFLISASHSDSPSLKIKENPEMVSQLITRLNVEKYGGMIVTPWFDRILSFAGRIIYSEKTDGKVKICQKLVNAEKDLLMIPNLAVHLDHEINQGKKVNFQEEMLPIVSAKKDFSLKSYLQEISGVDKENILGYDLFLYNRDEGRFWGADEEFISSPKLDDLECVWTTFKGFLDACENREDFDKRSSFDKNKVIVHAVFDNEEVGSQSRQGAASTFLYDVLFRINECFGRSSQKFCTAVANSFLVSADNAHAVHPNYVHSYDPVNRPEVNEGPVIKFNASQKYTSDGISGGIFKTVCENAKVPFQIYTNNSNVPGGSTLGNISMSQVSVRAVDIGLAQWSMHSPNESAGAKDVDYMRKALGAFYDFDVELGEGLN